MKIVFVGGGHIARALLCGLAGKHTVTVVDRNSGKRSGLAAIFNVAVAADVREISAAPDVFVVAVRPPQVREVCEKIGGQQSLYISVAAGLRCDALAGWLQSGNIVRAMPNMPMQVGEGFTFCVAGPAADATAKKSAEEIFSGGGKVAWLEDENLMEAATAVAGSSPAYVYYFIAAMADAAVEMGVDKKTAQAAVLQTFRGAAKMVEESGQSPADLCRAVAVPGGATEKALAVFAAHKMDGIIGDAMRACAARAGELGGGGGGGGGGK